MQTHLRVRRLWLSAHELSALTDEEKAHLTECGPCYAIFKLCLKATDFDDLKEFKEDSEGIDDHKKSA